VTDASSPEVAVLGALDRRGVATLTLNRPEKGNRYNQAMLDTLLAEMTRLGADPAVRIIVLRAGGKHFCVGAEIGEEQPTAKDAPRATIPGLCLAFDEVPKPTVALVHGACIGRRRARVMLRHRHRRARCILFPARGEARLCAGAVDSILSACHRPSQPAPLSAVRRALHG
jgi:hypothetical protein